MISFYSGKTIHTFINSGVFTTTAPITGAEVVLIAGGGAGGSQIGGGGGAGGYVALTSQSFSDSTAYPVVIGAGGAGRVASNWPSGPPAGESGFDTVFNSVTASGGGGGGSYAGSGDQPTRDGLNGGSGGGGTTLGADGLGNKQRNSSSASSPTTQGKMEDLVAVPTKRCWCWWWRWCRRCWSRW